MAITAILAAALLWASLGPVSRFAHQSGLSPELTALWRTLIAAVCFATQAALRREISISRSDLPVLALFGLCAVAGLNISYQYAVILGGAGLASILLYTAPVWVALLARLFLKEPVTRSQMAAMALVFAGISGIVLSGGSNMVAGPAAYLAGLLSGFTYALYYIFGKVLFRRLPVVTVFAWGFAFATLFLALLVRPSWPPSGALVPVLCIGVVSTWMAYLAYSYALTRLPAVQVAVMATIEPVLSGIMATLIWKESMHLYGYLAASLVLAGILLVALKPAATS